MNRTRQLASFESHPLRHILASRQRGMMALRYTLVLVVVLTSVLGVQFALQSLTRPHVYQKDFIQEYLLAKATLEGMNPYLPLPELASELIGPLPNPILQHPTPHPPPVALLALPLGLLTYENAAALWLVFEVLCIIATVYLLLDWLVPRPGWKLVVVTTLLAMAWNPVWEELVVGQLMVLVSVLLVGAWRALRSGRSIIGGVFLGCAIALKLIAWPLAIFLAIRRNWRAVGAAGITVIVFNLLAALVMGFEHASSAYLHVGGHVFMLYRAHEHNTSLWSVGWRFFEGTGSTVTYGLQAPPLTSAPDIAPWASTALALAGLVIGLRWALDARCFDTSFALLLGVSVMVSPVAWRHYVLLMALPLVVGGRYLSALNWPRRKTTFAILTWSLLFIPRTGLHRFMLLLTGQSPMAKSSPSVPFVVGLISLAPAVVIWVWLWLLRQLDLARTSVT